MPRRTFDWSKLSRPSTSPIATEGSADAPCGATTPSISRPADRSAIPATEDRRPTTFFLRVNDLKQYAYCPRIVFYQYSMPVQRKATFKMERGKLVEPTMERLEQRRTLRRYGLAAGARRFQVWLSASQLGLSGRLDLLITTPDAAFPVDFKDTRERVHHNHHVQLCAYALLVERALGQSVPAGFIYRVPLDDVVAVDITPALRLETERLLNEIREMIRAERMPPPTSVRARCADCEYRNYCGDVF